METPHAQTYGFDPRRLEKRAVLYSRDNNPYPYTFSPTHQVGQVLEEAHAREQAGQALALWVRLAGRIWARRDMGRACFMDLQDQSGKVQLYFNQKILGPAWEELFLLDLGDLVGIEGEVFRTRTGELSVQVKHWLFLAKALVPIPIGKESEEAVYYRMTDLEARYRERHLHWLLDRPDRERLRQRSRIISSLRRQMEANAFLEVATPTITATYGGAEAHPFTTAVRALDNQEQFLRISPELHLKRYIVAGFEKVFTICQNFRNEGIDRSHNPEFTMMEWYEAFTDYEEQMCRFEDLVAGVCAEVCGSAHIVYQGTELDFSPSWRRLSMLDALREHAGVDAGALSAQELQVELERRGVESAEPLSWGLAVARLFEVACEGCLVQPTFVLDHPLEISPLARVRRGDGRLAERFEVYVCGMELGNAYSELTDPLEQLDRFLAQRRTQGEATHPLDADFVRALGCGMPPTGGVGLGIDRLVMLLTDAASIRDVIPFPMVKARQPATEQISGTGSERVCGLAVDNNRDNNNQGNNNHTSDGETAMAG
ncbi:MAG: lysine--tRNA ligase [Candidatus Latescibacteria bacterium]|nr:lysine--tRNA ligase [Candidatus Latescibacterota bacterium]